MFTESVKVYTVTPLWTGNAHGKYKKLKPQSLLGSLRFWFEIYCYARGILKKGYKDDKVYYAKFVKIINKIFEENNKISIFEAKQQALRRLEISVPSQVFGCNGWEGSIKIKKIYFAVNRNKEIRVPRKICKKKGEDQWQESCPNDKKKYHFWYFPEDYFYGHFTIEFQLMDESLKEEVLYPLLYFIQKYGFLGGKNNLGFGRVRFELQDKELSNYDSFKYIGKEYSIEQAVDSNIQSFNEFYNEFNKIGLFKIKEIEEANKDFFEKIIKKLIKIKSDERYEYKKNNSGKKDLRHFIFGATSNRRKGIKETNATKIIPWINQLEDNRYEYGFISLILLKNFPGE